MGEAVDRQRESEVAGGTRKLPWFTLVEVDLCDGPAGEATVENLLEKIVGYELLVGRVEAETRWKLSIAALELVGVEVHWEPR